MMQAITVSCNAYFAQLGTYVVGAEQLHETADLLDIPAGEVREIKKMMPFAAYGQGPVLVTPFKMARVAATDRGRRIDARRADGSSTAATRAPMRREPFCRPSLRKCSPRPCAR